MRPLLLMCLVIGGIAVAAPNIFARYYPHSATSETAAVMAAGPAGKPAGAQTEGGREVEIRAERDGHFYVDATVNFRPVRLLVDTGATVVALRESDAAAAGIHVTEADFNDPIQTANGTTNAAQAQIESITVSDIEVRNVRALIVPDDRLAISLLGGSFLHSLHRFEVADDRLIIEN